MLAGLPYTAKEFYIYPVAFHNTGSVTQPACVAVLSVSSRTVLRHPPGSQDLHGKHCSALQEPVFVHRAASFAWSCRGMRRGAQKKDALAGTTVVGSQR